MKKVYLLLLSLVVLMIALTGCGKDTDSAKDTSKPITLRYSTMQNKDHISYQVALNIKQAVEEKTEGRVLIDIYPANQLGDWSQVYDELMMGSIDMAHSSVPETYDARTAVGYFPYLSSSYDQLAEIFAEGTSLDNMMKEIQAKNGIEFCGFFVEGIAGIGTTKYRILTLWIVRIPLSALPLWTAIFSPANIWASTQQALLPPTPLRLFRPALLRALQAPLLRVHILTIVISLITTMYIR